MQIDVLVAEIGSTTTLVNAFNNIESADPVFLGQGSAPTSIIEGDVRIGLDAAIKNLKKQEISRILISPEPYAKRTVEGDLGIYINRENAPE